MKRYFVKQIRRSQIKTWNKLVKRHIALMSLIEEKEDSDIAKLQPLLSELRTTETKFKETFDVDIDNCKPIELTITGIHKSIIEDRNDFLTIKCIIENSTENITYNETNKIYQKCVNNLEDKQRVVYLLMNHSSKYTMDESLFQGLHNLTYYGRYREENFTLKEISESYEIQEYRVKQLYYDALNNMIKNIKPYIADLNHIDYMDRTIEQCENIPTRVRTTITRAFKFMPDIPEQSRHISWIIEQDVYNSDFRGLGDLTFREMDDYFTDRLGTLWKRSKMYTNLYNYYQKKSCSGKSIPISKDRMKEIITIARTKICDGKMQCAGLGCKKCMINKLNITEEEYTILFGEN